LISNLLEFEITGRDQEWEARTLEGAVRILNSSSDPSARTEAARSISYLGTAGATDEMAQRLYQHAPRRGGLDPGDDLDAHWLRGLYGGRDRALVVGRMERELDRPERYVSAALASHLALLALTGRSNARPIASPAYQSQVRSYLNRHAAARKAGDRVRRSSSSNHGPRSEAARGQQLRRPSVVEPERRLRDGRPVFPQTTTGTRRQMSSFECPLGHAHAAY
jgi:hypothetical protein